MDGSNCSFTGALPEAAFQGAWLGHIDLSGNKLSGSISNTLTSFAMLVSILVRPETYDVKLLHACLLQLPSYLHVSSMSSPSSCNPCLFSASLHFFASRVHAIHQSDQQLYTGFAGYTAGQQLFDRHCASSHCQLYYVEQLRLVVQFHEVSDNLLQLRRTV